MANNLSAFNAQAWSKRLVQKLDQINIMLGLVNKDYEGELQNVGDTVQVRTPGNITMSSYTKGATLNYQDLAPAKEPFKISDAEYFAFEVDDIDKAQNDVNAMDVYMKRAVVAMNNAVESKCLVKGSAGVQTANWITSGTPVGSGGVPGTATVTSGAVTAIATGTGGSGYENPPLVVISGGGGVGALAHATISGGAITGYVIDNGGQNYTSAPTVTLINQDPVVLDSSTSTSTGIYQMFCKARALLSKGNVPLEGRWSIVDPDTTSLLLEDTAHFVRATEFGDVVVQEGKLGVKVGGQAKPGLIGRCAGFDVYECNHVNTVNLLDGSSNPIVGKELLFGDNEMISYAAQISQLEALRLQTTFADAVRGLLLHDAIVFAECAKRGAVLLAKQ